MKFFKRKFKSRRRYGRRRIGKRVRRTVRRTIQNMAEKKSVSDYISFNPELSGTWRIAELTPLINQGTSSMTRIGKDIRLTHLRVRLFVQARMNPNSSVGTYASVARVILFWGRQTIQSVGTPYAAHDIVEVPSSSIEALNANMPYILAPTWPLNSKIILDKTFNLAPLTNAEESGLVCQKLIGVSKKLHKPVHYDNNSTGFPRDIRNRLFVMFAISNRYTPPTPAPTQLEVSHNTRWKFIDM